MSAPNIDPIYSRAGAIGLGTAITTAANDYTGVSTSNVCVFTADSTNGSFVQRIRLKPCGTNVASVARIFINNGSSQTTAANNTFYGEISLPATTLSASAALAEIDYPLNLALPPGYKIYVGLGTTVAAGWTPTVIAGNY
ncbi:MAG TPA: hypothetical protein VN436_02255 [Holophaga sp.]|nr:hypothetical protein [Holophaga sp.]